MKKLFYLGLTALMMLFSLGSARGQDEGATAAKVKVTLEPTTWTRGLSTPKFKVEITSGQSDGVELGTDQGKLAVKVTFTKQGSPAAKEEAITQLLTQATETSINPSSELEDGTWVLSYGLVKGDNSGAFGDGAEMAEDCTETLSVVTPILVFDPADGEVEEGTEIKITCSNCGEVEAKDNIVFNFYEDMKTATENAESDFDDQDGEWLDSETPTVTEAAPVLAAAIYDIANYKVLSLKYAQYTVKAAEEDETPIKVTISFDKNEWTAGSEDVITATVTVEPAEALTLGDQEGNHAIKVELYDEEYSESTLTSGLVINKNSFTFKMSDLTLSEDPVWGLQDLEPAMQPILKKIGDSYVADENIDDADLEITIIPEEITLKKGSTQGGGSESAVSPKEPTIMTTTWRKGDQKFFRGTYQVTIVANEEDDDSDIKFYYTKGENPADPTIESEELESGAYIDITGPCTVKAIAARGEKTSPVAKATYTYYDEPEIVLMGAGGYALPEKESKTLYGKNVPIGVTAEIDEEGTSLPNIDLEDLALLVLYTTDGTEPNMGSMGKDNVFEAQLDGRGNPYLLFTENTLNLKVKVFVSDNGSFVDSSQVKTVELVAYQVPAPVLSPESGAETDKVTVENADKFMMIYYTTDGTIPSLDRRSETGVYEYESTGIELTKASEVNVIGYYMDFGMSDLDVDGTALPGVGDDQGWDVVGHIFGSDVVTATYTVPAPTLPDDEDGAPELTFNPDNTESVYYGTEVFVNDVPEGYSLMFGTFATLDEAQDKWDAIYYAYGEGGYPKLTTERPILVIKLGQWISYGWERDFEVEYIYYRYYDVLANSDIAAPTIEVLEVPAEAKKLGIYPKGTRVMVDADLDMEYDLWYTTDGSIPSAENDKTEKVTDGYVYINADSSMIIRALAVTSEGKTSNMATSVITLCDGVKASLQMRRSNNAEVDTIIGKNSPILLSLDVKDFEDLKYEPYVVYYSLDGTEPTAEAYEAQEGESIKMLQGEQERDIYPAILVEKQPTTIKAKAYLQLYDGPDDVIVSDLLEYTIDSVIGLEAPQFSIADGTEVKIGDTLRIKNPNPEVWEEGEGMLDPWSMSAAPKAVLGGQPAQMYFSLNGPRPSSENMSLDGVFTTSNMEYEDEIIVVFQKDEKGLYAYVPANTKYADGSDTIRFTESLQIQAICYDNILYGESMNWFSPGTLEYGSDFAEATYTVSDEDSVDPSTVQTPTFNPAAGEVEKGTKVAITCATEGATIYYTVNGEEPTEESTEYSAEISIESAMTIKAIAVKEGMVNSIVATAAYTVKADEPVVADTVQAPTFNPAAGEVEKGTKVTISCATEGATIYYTTDGTTPTSSSTKYEAAVEINEDVTIKAIAVKEGWVSSKVAEAAYTVKGEGTANEDAELAGINIYPNPNDGKFNVLVPVEATVEVFNTNAQLVFRAELVAGVHSLQLANSGMYFVRFTSENAQVIKRVIVR